MMSIASVPISTIGEIGLGTTPAAGGSEVHFLEHLNILGAKLRRRRLIARRPPWEELADGYRIVLKGLGARDEDEGQSEKCLRGYTGLVHCNLAHAFEGQRLVDRAAFHATEGARALFEEQRDVSVTLGGSFDFGLLKLDAMSPMLNSIYILVQDDKSALASALFAEMAELCLQLDDVHSALNFFLRAAHQFRRMPSCASNLALAAFDGALLAALRIRDVAALFEIFALKKETYSRSKNRKLAPIVNCYVSEILLASYEHKFDLVCKYFDALCSFVQDIGSVAQSSSSPSLSSLSSSDGATSSSPSAPTSSSTSPIDWYIAQLTDKGHLLDGFVTFLIDLLWAIDLHQLEGLQRILGCSHASDLTPDQREVLHWIQKPLFVSDSI